MSLQNQIYLYSVATDHFYTSPEKIIHQKLLKLYKARKKLRGNKVLFSSTNRLIKKYKNKIMELLNTHLQSHQIRELDENSLNTKNVITLFESNLTRALKLEPKELTLDLIIVNVYFFQVLEDLIKNGFLYKNERYIFLSASAGQIRTKRAVFIKSSRYDEIKLQLMCGLTTELINEKGGVNPNKFNAYLSLNNSATDVWENFNIDKSIVVNDFENVVTDEVDFIDHTTYTIKREKRNIPLNHTDGCGMMLYDTTRMIRAPWIKGLMVQFPFDVFAKNHHASKVKDIYGKEHDIIEEDIQYIFTKSQFKMYKYYEDWDDYKNKFKKYHCTANYCNEEDKAAPQARINYQMLQTLSDITEDEIKKLTSYTHYELNNIASDFQTAINILGANKNNKDPSYFQQGIRLYPELLHDCYTKKILRETKKSLIKQAKGGRLRINGRYTFIVPDLYAFCEYLFLNNQNPSGLLENNEVYTTYYKNNSEIACLRSPHLSKEWAVRINKRGTDKDCWFGQNCCLYVSCKDLIAKLLQADFDGDTTLVIKDKNITTIAKRNMKNVVPLYYEMAQSKGLMLNSENIYNGIAQAFTSGNIGPISNLITSIYNSEDGNSEEAYTVIKWLCMETNFFIDQKVAI